MSLSMCWAVDRVIYNNKHLLLRALACPSTDMDEVFRKKLDKNKSRPFQYGEGHRTKSQLS